VRRLKLPRYERTVFDMDRVTCLTGPGQTVAEAPFLPEKLTLKASKSSCWTNLHSSATPQPCDTSHFQNHKQEAAAPLPLKLTFSQQCTSC
jgi:hypothetical protein